jgi:hypothetical protein
MTNASPFGAMSGSPAPATVLVIDPSLASSSRRAGAAEASRARPYSRPDDQRYGTAVSVAAALEAASGLP